MVSASTYKEKLVKGAHNLNPNAGLLVAQSTSNFFDPNDLKFNHPLTFNNDSEMGFCLNLENESKKSSNAGNRKKKYLQSSPSIFHFADRVEWFEREKGDLFPLTLKK